LQSGYDSRIACLKLSPRRGIVQYMGVDGIVMRFQGKVRSFPFAVFGKAIIDQRLSRGHDKEQSYPFKSVGASVGIRVQLPDKRKEKTMTAARQLKAISTTAKESSVEGAPLTADAFDALMKPFGLEDGARVGLAVSGGPDSMALALCVLRWVERQGDPSPAKSRALRGNAGILLPLPQGERKIILRAFIVDHRLRAESAAEAEMTRQRLEAMGIEAEVLRWDHPSVTARLHVEARKARYDLLIAACKRHGLRDLLFAHHRDDQAETILMRLAKGSGLDGLAGMACETTRDGVRLLRPFLDVKKKRLLATCVANKAGYALDPSNAASKYARGRLRRVEAMLAEEGFTQDRLIDLGGRAREAKEALGHYTRALLRVAANMDAAGVIRFNLEQLRSAPQATASRAVGACLHALNAADYAPKRAMLLPLLEALSSDEPMNARTLHGCVISKGAKAATFVREMAAITDVKPIAPGETVLWDGRWQIALSKSCDMKNLVVRPLGAQPRKVVDELAPALRHRVPQGRARAVLPALWDGATLAIVPDFFGYLSTAPARAEIIRRF